jgi:hypothetical protein
LEQLLATLDELKAKIKEDAEEFATQADQNY